MLEKIQRELKELEKNFRYEKNKADRAQELLELIFEKYARPELQKKIDKEPYRVAGRVEDPKSTYGHDDAPEEFSRIIYIVERQCASWDMYYSLRDPEKTPTFETYWSEVGRFEIKEQAELAMQELLKG